MWFIRIFPLFSFTTPPVWSRSSSASLRLHGLTVACLSVDGSGDGTVDQSRESRPAGPNLIQLLSSRDRMVGWRRIQSPAETRGHKQTESKGGAKRRSGGAVCSQLMVSLRAALKWSGWNKKWWVGGEKWGQQTEEERNRDVTGSDGQIIRTTTQLDSWFNSSFILINQCKWSTLNKNMILWIAESSEIIQSCNRKAPNSENEADLNQNKQF